MRAATSTPSFATTTEVASIPIQATPKDSRVAHLNDHTSIMRHWHPGDTRRCHLCQHCSADNDACMILVSTHVTRSDSWMFSTVAMAAQASNHDVRSFA